MFFHEVKNSSKVDVPRGDVMTRPLFHESSGSDLSDKVNSNARLTLAKFRSVQAAIVRTSFYNR
jgi:hypothetical protein